MMATLNTPVNSLDSLYLRRKRGGVKNEGLRSREVSLSYPTPLSLAAAGCTIDDEEWSGVLPSSGFPCGSQGSLNTSSAASLAVL